MNTASFMLEKVHSLDQAPYAIKQLNLLPTKGYREVKIVASNSSDF